MEEGKGIYLKNSLTLLRYTANSDHISCFLIHKINPIRSIGNSLKKQKSMYIVLMPSIP